MTKIRKAARGQPCLVRIPGVCDGGGETTVLAHYRMSGYCGTGIKPDDFAFGAFCCARCHDAIDGRSSLDESRESLRLYHAEGVMRTQAKLVEMGIIRGAQSDRAADKTFSTCDTAQRRASGRNS